MIPSRLGKRSSISAKALPSAHVGGLRAGRLNGRPCESRDDEDDEEPMRHEAFYSTALHMLVILFVVLSIEARFFLEGRSGKGRLLGLLFVGIFAYLIFYVLGILAGAAPDSASNRLNVRILVVSLIVAAGITGVIRQGAISREIRSWRARRRRHKPPP
jgi:hypothetical protein